MSISEAINLLRKGVKAGNNPENWVDLGCGTGLFTQALIELLPAGSKVVGVDRSPQRLPSSFGSEGPLTFLQADFTDPTFDWDSPLDGILMANSLHYVAGQQDFLEKAKGWMGERPHFLLVEYDTELANPWVPYPISYRRLGRLANHLGLTLEKVGSRTSVYQNGGMYAAWMGRGSQTTSL